MKPAVVSITSKLKAEPAEMEGPMPFPFGQMVPGQQRAIEARGSGFIVDPNGIVVTNNHVVKGAKSVTVVLDDGTQLPAKVVGTDPRTDLAVLKVDAGRKLPYIQLGDSSTIRPGQWVVAMGNPFGLGGSVTAGIVSAEGRDIGAGPYDQFIQIDAPINQGNSGGPLFTQDGKVVGVNTAILSPSGGSIGIGFAIPSNTVKTVVAELEKTGHVTRGYLGVEAQTDRRRDVEGAAPRPERWRADRGRAARFAGSQGRHRAGRRHRFGEWAENRQSSRPGGRGGEREARRQGETRCRPQWRAPDRYRDGRRRCRARSRRRARARPAKRRVSRG